MSDHAEAVLALLKEVVPVRRQTLASFLSLAARIVLEAAVDLEQALGHPLGRQKFVAVLRGSEEAFVRADDLNRLPHYGVFAAFDRAWVERLVLMLKETGSFCTNGLFRPVLTLSEEADTLVRNPDDMPVLPREALEDPILGPSVPRSALEKELRALRGRISSGMRRTPRQVLSDAAVRELCSPVPTSREETEKRLPEHVKPHAEAVWDVLRRNGKSVQEA